ncbi:MAG TPA: alpha/beta hydrolase [Spirochaetota bacterium]|nr:alpha/beta hydrolase [Spirochaetota bacterium]HQO38949.1 alpha/beta hydrolase [Spirochaetota bacterium]
MKTLNFISGLGADERVFQYLDVPVPDKNFVKWIDPRKNESLENYAARLASQIDPSKENVLICVSFGGLIGIELSKFFRFDKVILISSVKNKKEIPFYYRIAGLLRIDKFLPVFMFKSLTPLMLYLFGITDISEKELFREIIRETDAGFLKWAITRILCWKNIIHSDDIYHIHGTSDRLLPVKNIKNCIKVQGGHHFMVVSRSGEISGIINEILSF